MSGGLFGADGELAAGAERVPVASMTVVVYDRGQEARGPNGAAPRYEAELADYPVVRGFGCSWWEAVHRLVADHRGLLERRWSAWT